MLSKDLYYINYLLTKLVEEYFLWDLTSNANKTKYLVVEGTETAGEELNLKYERVTVVENYKYLGAQLANNETFKQKIEELMTKSSQMNKKIELVLLSPLFIKY